MITACVLSRRVRGVVFFIILASAACLAQDADDAEAQLNAAYKKCLNDFPAKAREQLRVAQRAWITFSNKNEAAAELAGRRRALSTEDLDRYGIDEAAARTEQLKSFFIQPSGDLQSCKRDLQRTEEELTSVYEQSLQTLTPDEQQKLREAQRSWIEYRDKDARAHIGDPTGRAPVWAAVELARRRTQELRGFYLGRLANARSASPGSLVGNPAKSASRGLRPPTSAAETQRNLDAASASGYVGQLLQRLADEQQVGKEMKNDWPLPPELMPEWKHALIGDIDNANWFHAERMNDQQLEELRRTFGIPKDEGIYAHRAQSELRGTVDDDSGFEAALTDKALYLHILPSGQEDFGSPPVLKPPGSLQHAADPIGLFRITHSAILATDTFGYNARLVPHHDQYTSEHSRNCIKIFGLWLVANRPVLDFGKAGPGDCHQRDDGQTEIEESYSYRHLQNFVASVFKCDADFAIKAARQRHLAGLSQTQSEPTGTGTRPAASGSSSDPLAGYLGVPWGSPFADVSRKFAAKAARDYKEAQISEAEWNRGYAGAAQEIRRFMGWSVPLRPPLSFFTFSDDTGIKTFLFHRDRFYAVTNLSDKNWVEQNGVDTLVAMYRKYGRPNLHLARSWTATQGNPLAPREFNYSGNIIRAVWENDSGIIFSPLTPTKNVNHINIHPLRDAYVSVSIPPRNFNWMLHVEAAGFIPPDASKDRTIMLKQPQGEGQPREVTVKLPGVPTTGVNRKLLALILNIKWEKPEDSATSNTAALGYLSSKVSVWGQRNNSYKPVSSALSPKDILPLDHQYPPGHGDAEWVLFVDVPMNVEDGSLQIESPEITDLAGNKVQIEGRQIIDLEQTTNRWVCVGQLTDTEMEQYQFGIGGATTYVSAPIWKEMAEATEIERAKKEQKKKEVEKRQQKELEEKF
jgi:uncharacterized protein YecT (DUF1311 family)